MFWSKILRFFSEDIAMDLGTANTLLYTRDGGIIVNEPSVVAIDTRNNEVLAVGSEAKRARGRTPKRIKTIRPMKSGVIADFDTTSRMIVYFVNKAIGRSHLVKPSLVISVPTGITGVEKKAVIDAAALPVPDASPSLRSPWQRLSARICPSPNPWAPSSPISAAGPARWPSSPCQPSPCPSPSASRATP